MQLGVPHAIKVLLGRNDCRKVRGVGVDRDLVTAVECISADGRSPHPLIIRPAASRRSNWTTHPTPGWHYACTQSGYTNAEIHLQWLQQVFEPSTAARARGQPRVLICDGLSTHESAGVVKFCLAHNIIPCRLPSHTSHKTQPCDVGPFGPLKAAYRDIAEKAERLGLPSIGKAFVTLWYSGLQN